MRVPVVGSAVGAVGRRASRAGLGALDTLLGSQLAADAVDRVAGSPLVERALQRVLEGPLVDAIARDLVRYRVAERLLSEGLVEQTAARVLEGPLLDQAIDRLLAGDELWMLVDEVARSPAVTAAITQQSVGFADQVAGGVRARSRSADAWLERRARRILGRSQAP